MSKLNLDDILKEYGVTKDQLRQFIDKAVEEIGTDLLKRVDSSGFPGGIKLMVIGEIISRIAGATWAALHEEYGIRADQFLTAIVLYGAQKKAALETDDAEELGQKGNA